MTFVEGRSSRVRAHSFVNSLRKLQFSLIRLFHNRFFSLVPDWRRKLVRIRLFLKARALERRFKDLLASVVRIFVLNLSALGERHLR